MLLAARGANSNRELELSVPLCPRGEERRKGLEVESITYGRQKFNQL